MPKGIKVLVELQLSNVVYTEVMIICDGHDISAFRVFVKKLLSPVLKQFQPFQLFVYETDGLEPISPDKMLSELKFTKCENLIVKTEPELVMAKIDSITAYHSQSKTINTCRAYLTSVAVELEKLYDLEKTGNYQIATFHEIKWNRSRNPPRKTGNGENSIPDMANFFNQQEWQFLENLDKQVNPAFYTELETEVDGKS